MLSERLPGLPIIAVLRGITPADVVPVGEILVREGVQVLEVTLNSPEPYRSITELAQRLGAEALVGAGTVMHAEQVRQVKRAGARLIVSPHADTELIATAKAENMLVLPGCFSPTEIVAAHAAGADAIKLFPAEVIPPVAIRAIRAVVPPAMELFPTGGIDAGNMAAYLRAGADGFAIGSSLYKPGKTLTEIETDARTIVTTFKQAQQGREA